MSDTSAPPPDAEQAQLLKMLASRDPEEADAAVARIWRKGPATAAVLLALRGHTEPFTGRSLYNPRSSMALPRAHPRFEVPASEKHRLLSVEAAALYLLCALLKGELHFAQSPLLFDPSEPLETRRAGNTPEKLARAFAAAEAWAGRIPGTAGAGPTPQDPIGSSGLIWY